MGQKLQYVNREEWLKEVLASANLIFLVASATGVAMTAEPPEEALREIQWRWIQGKSVGAPPQVAEWYSQRVGCNLPIDSCVYLLGAIRPTVVGVFKNSSDAMRALVRMYGHLTNGQVIDLNQPPNQTTLQAAAAGA